MAAFLWSDGGQNLDGFENAVFHGSRWLLDGQMGVGWAMVRWELDGYLSRWVRWVGSDGSQMGSKCPVLVWHISSQTEQESEPEFPIMV